MTAVPQKFTILESAQDIELVKEIALLGVRDMNTDKALAHCKGLRECNWFLPIEDPLLRKELQNIIDMLATHLKVAAESPTIGIQESDEVKLIETVIEMGVVDVDVDEATQLCVELQEENWFPHIERTLLRKELQAISNMFDEQFGCSRTQRTVRV